MSRPKSRNDEAQMWVVWRLVREKMQGGTIRSTCISLMREAKIRIEGHASIVSADLLRKRYQEAERGRKDPQKFPILSLRAEQWLADRQDRQASQLAAVRLAVEHELAKLPDGTTREKRNRLTNALGKVLLVVDKHPTAPLSVRLLPHCKSITTLRSAYKKSLSLDEAEVKKLAWAEFNEPERMAHFAEVLSSLSRDGFPQGEGLKSAEAINLALNGTYEPRLKKPR